jgi:hypothetical protein
VADSPTCRLRVGVFSAATLPWSTVVVAWSIQKWTNRILIQTSVRERLGCKVELTHGTSPNLLVGPGGFSSVVLQNFRFVLVGRLQEFHINTNGIRDYGSECATGSFAMRAGPWDSVPAPNLATAITSTLVRCSGKLGNS